MIGYSLMPGSGSLNQKASFVRLLRYQKIDSHFDR